VLRQVAEGVLIHESEFCQSNAVVVHGRAGVLLIDPGVDGYEMACLAHDLSDSGQTVMAGFSTHPHWDHLLWHARLGAAPRYGTARCAATARDLAAGAARRDIRANFRPLPDGERVPRFRELPVDLPPGAERSSVPRANQAPDLEPPYGIEP
jgi:glyoxylase-like metal-dependent hydrolase (beta-lactamase superfamily II)